MRNAAKGAPFVCAGGACAYNPEPLAEIIDFFIMGEGEEVMGELMDAYRVWKQSGAPREAYLEAICEIEGFMSPRL